MCSFMHAPEHFHHYILTPFTTTDYTSICDIIGTGNAPMLEHHTNSTPRGPTGPLEGATGTAGPRLDTATCLSRGQVLTHALRFKGCDDSNSEWEPAFFSNIRSPSLQE